MISTRDKIELARINLKRGLEFTKEAAEELDRMEKERRAASIELSYSQIAALLGKSQSTAIRMIQDGRLKGKNFTDVMDYKLNRRK